MDSLFDEEPERDAFLQRVEALVAPVAANAGAVVDEAGLLDVAKAVYGAFGDMEASGGLTRAQLSHACRYVTDESSFQRTPLRREEALPRTCCMFCPPSPGRRRC